MYRMQNNTKRRKLCFVSKGDTNNHAYYKLICTGYGWKTKAMAREELKSKSSGCCVFRADSHLLFVNIYTHTPVQFSALQVFFAHKMNRKKHMAFKSVFKIFTKTKAKSYAKAWTSLNVQVDGSQPNGNRVDFVCVVPCLQHASADTRCIMSIFSFSILHGVQVTQKMIPLSVKHPLGAHK